MQHTFVNVTGINLNHRTTTRFEENKANFEALLRETIKMKINERIKKS